MEELKGVVEIIQKTNKYFEIENIQASCLSCGESHWLSDLDARAVCIDCNRAKISQRQGMPTLPH